MIYNLIVNDKLKSPKQKNIMKVCTIVNKFYQKYNKKKYQNYNNKTLSSDN